MFWRYWDTRFVINSFLAWYVRIEFGIELALTELKQLQYVLNIKSNLNTDGGYNTLEVGFSSMLLVSLALLCSTPSLRITLTHVRIPCVGHVRLESPGSQVIGCGRKLVDRSLHLAPCVSAPKR